MLTALYESYILPKLIWAISSKPIYDLRKTCSPWRSLPRDFAPWATGRAWPGRFSADEIWLEGPALLTWAVRVPDALGRP